MSERCRGEEDAWFCIGADLREQNEKMRAALQSACDETDYCYACNQHPSHGHSADCPLTTER